MRAGGAADLIRVGIGPPSAIKPGSPVLVGKGEPHQVTNTGDEPLVTVNFYAPGAYTTDGDVKRSVKRK